MLNFITLRITSSHIIDLFGVLGFSGCEFVEVLCFLQPLNHFLTFCVTPLCLLLVSVGGGCGHHSVCARCRDKKKGSDPCIKTPPAPCVHCDALTPEQKDQLATPSYKLKKEKKEAKSSTPLKESDTLSPTLVDPALVSVVGVVDGQSTSGASGLSGPMEKKAKKAEAKHPTKTKSDKPAKSPSSRPLTSSTDQGKSTTSSTDTKIADP